MNKYDNVLLFVLLLLVELSDVAFLPDRFYGLISSVCPTLSRNYLCNKSIFSDAVMFLFFFLQYYTLIHPFHRTFTFPER